MTIAKTRKAFCIGEFVASDPVYCPGIPLAPEVLLARESLKVGWVELMFENQASKLQHIYIFFSAADTSLHAL